MSWSTDPKKEWLKYRYGRWAFAASAGAALSFGFWHAAPEELEKAFKAPIARTYTRPDAPGLEVAIRTSSERLGGMSAAQQSMMDQILNGLPAEHLKGVKFIGYSPNNHMVQVYDTEDQAAAEADSSGAIVINSQHISTNNMNRFREVVLHEIGHRVEATGLTVAEKQAWLGIYNRSARATHSRVPQPQLVMSGSSNYNRDFVSDYAETNEGEDFAEVYNHWGRNSASLEFNAIDALREGHTALLEKCLFMMGLFMKKDGTVQDYTSNSYYEVFANDTGPDIFHDSYTPVWENYYRYRNGLTYGGYTFRFSDGRITRVEDIYGRVVADNLNIAIPPTILNHWAETGPPPEPAMIPTYTETSCDPNVDCDAHSDGEIVAQPGKLGNNSYSVVSPNLPTDYLPIMSQVGMRAMIAEQGSASGTADQLTVQDLLRPHGLTAVSRP